MMDVSYSPHYVASDFAFDTTRKSKAIAESLDLYPIDGVRLLAPDTMIDTAEIIRTMHANRYVDAVMTGEPLHLAVSNGFRRWDAGMYEMALAHCAGVVCGARRAIETGGIAGTLSSGLHHAKRSHGDGYCTFNGIAAAVIDTLQRDINARVAIFDVDAHCGGGTDDMVGSLEAVTHVDLYVDEFDLYPARPGQWLKTAGSADEYRARTAEAVAFILDEHRRRPFDLCIYNAGVDPVDEDFIDGTDIFARDEFVAGTLTTQIPTVFTLAGGYTSSETDARMLTELHRGTIEAFAKAGSN